MASTTHSNPLLTFEFAPRFDAIAAEHVEPAVDFLLKEAQQKLDALIADPAPRTFASTLEGLEDVSDRLGVAMGVVGHLESVMTNPDLRAAYNAVQPKVTAFFSALTLNAKLYDVLKAYSLTADAKTLKGTRRRFLDKTLADFRRQGAELPAEGKARLSALDVELSELTLKFSQNVLDATNAFDLVVSHESELSGLPASVKDAAKASAESRGKKGYRFTLQAPSYIPVMTYADNAALRRTLWQAYNTRATVGATDNRELIARILELRKEKATLLGFANFADLVLDDRMAKRGESAWEFIARLRDKTQPFFVAENHDLQAFRREFEGPQCPALEPWDVAYYAEKERLARYDFDEEALRPYFSAEAVLQGLFAIAHKLYGIRIEPWQGAAVWHPSVTAYRVLDRDKTELGAFYVDIYPRETKRDGAWMDGLVTGVWQEDRRTRHLEVLAANVTPPLGDKPALLNHREVETMFHEFGHLMHHVLSKVEVRSLAGTNVAWDFVELPSMIMENWSWDAQILASFAKHYETGETIPEALVAKMRKARNFRAANGMMRQLGFSAVDLALHIKQEAKTGGDVLSYARQMMQEYSPAPLPADYGMIAGFSHLFSSPVGYAAGYYSYKWAEVLDADAFTEFQSEGLLNEGTGARFRETILSKGDSEDPMDLYRAFKGREPLEDALLERSGLLPQLTQGA